MLQQLIIIFLKFVKKLRVGKKLFKITLLIIKNFINQDYSLTCKLFNKTTTINLSAVLFEKNLPDVEVINLGQMGPTDPTLICENTDRAGENLKALALSTSTTRHGYTYHTKDLKSLLVLYFNYIGRKPYYPCC